MRRAATSLPYGRSPCPSPASAYLMVDIVAEAPVALTPRRSHSPTLQAIHPLQSPRKDVLSACTPQCQSYTYTTLDGTVRRSHVPMDLSASPAGYAKGRATVAKRATVRAPSSPTWPSANRTPAKVVRHQLSLTPRTDSQPTRDSADSRGDSAWFTRESARRQQKPSEVRIVQRKPADLEQTVAAPPRPPSEPARPVRACVGFDTRVVAHSAVNSRWTYESDMADTLEATVEADEATEEAPKPRECFIETVISPRKPIQAEEEEPTVEANGLSLPPMVEDTRDGETESEATPRSEPDSTLVEGVCQPDAHKTLATGPTAKLLASAMPGARPQSSMDMAPAASASVTDAASSSTKAVKAPTIPLEVEAHVAVLELLRAELKDQLADMDRMSEPFANHVAALEEARDEMEEEVRQQGIDVHVTVLRRLESGLEAELASYDALQVHVGALEVLKQRLEEELEQLKRQ